jgi:hypothetical protein
MKIKNISRSEVIIAGAKIQPDQSVNISAFGSEFVFANYKDEIEDAIFDEIIVFVDDDTGEYITDMAVIEAEFSNIHIQQPAEDNTINPDFYYNYKQIELGYKDEIYVEFVGYLKTINAFSKSGDIDLQIVEPLMNKVYVTESNNYEIDADYKLLNPIIKITARTNASVQLYMDGVFKHDTKTKKQYLKEIYSNSTFPTSDPYEGGLEFKVNFKRTITNNVFRDVIKNSIGQTYNRATLLNFNKFEDSAYVRFGDVCKLETDKDFTINMWFKSLESLSAKQYIVFKRAYFEFYIEQGILKSYIDGYRTEICEVEQDKFYMITMTYSAVDNTTNFYLNDELVKKQYRRHTFTTSAQNLYFGSRFGTYCFRSAELGEFNYFSHHMSAGMIHNLYANNHPEHQFRNLNAGCHKLVYTLDTSLDLINSYSAGIIKKEFARPENLITASKAPNLNNTDTNENLTVHSGYIYIPADGKYTFSATYTGNMILVIDDKDVLVNETERSYYIEEGYYPFSVTSINSFHITYGLKDDDASEVAVFNNDNEETIFELDNQKGADCTGVDDLVYENGNYTTVTNLDEDFFGSTFTISLDVKNEDSEAEIFAQGKLWNEYISLTLQDKRFVLVYKNTRIESCKIEEHAFNNITITADGSKVYLYLNKRLQRSATFGNFDRHNSDLFIGRSAEGYKQDWISGDFTLKNVKFYNTYSTLTEIQGR